ncbi:subtilisin-like protein [Ascobolus immersus RN42]|uniref:Subtilisin-like protein n=1 Tax=Ascobolus immersus RN42 TaxID=1160509 RepID=A0A3N4I857_ASCIM|nr:subtilisin-like protein [Ascobolus immersus RN42]
MRVFPPLLLLFLLLFGTSFIAVLAQPSPPVGSRSPEHTFIVRFRRCPAGKCVEDFYTQLNETKVAFRSISNHSSVILAATILEAPTMSLEQLAKLPGVRAVWSPTGSLEAMPLTEEQPDTMFETSPHNALYPRRKRFLVTSATPRFPTPPEGYVGLYGPSLHAATGVNRLHQAGFRGRGSKIAIVDDVMNPGAPDYLQILGLQPTILDAYNFVDQQTHVALSNPLTLSHGLRVAGVATGPFGVAPEAGLLLYTVMNETTPVEVLVGNLSDALERAISEGAHCINFSIGFEFGWADGYIHDLLKTLGDEGIISTASSTNSGHHGPWTLTFLSADSSIIGVGRYTEDVLPAYLLTASTGSEVRKILYQTGDAPTHAVTLNLKIPRAEFGVANNEVPDVSVHTLSSPTFGSDELLFLEYCQRPGVMSSLNETLNKGAGGLLLFGYKAVDYGSLQLKNPGKFAALIHSPEDYVWLKEQMQAGGQVAVTFAPPTADDTYGVSREDEEVHMRDKTSGQGPTIDLFLGISILAPGATLLSPTGCSSNPLAPFSGCSAASPYIAGLGALYHSSQVSADARSGSPMASRGMPEKFRNRLETSGHLLLARPNSNCPSYSGFDASWLQAGGRVNGWQTIFGALSISPGQLLLNDTENGSLIQQVTIENESNTNVDITITHLPGPGAYILKEDVEGGILTVNENYCLDSNLQAKATVTNPSFILGPLSSVSVEVRFTAPDVTEDKAKLMPYYGGWINVAANNVEVYHIAYFGAASPLKDIQLLQCDPEFLVVEADTTTKPVSEDITLTIGIDSLQKGRILVRQVLGTALGLWEFIPLGHALTEQSAIIFHVVQHDTRYEEVFDASTQQIIEQPRVTNITFDGSRVWSKPLKTWTVIEPGTYQVCVRLLKIFGDRSKAEGWERWCSDYTVTFIKATAPADDVQDLPELEGPSFLPQQPSPQEPEQLEPQLDAPQPPQRQQGEADPHLPHELLADQQHQRGPRLPQDPSPQLPAEHEPGLPRQPLA